MKTAPPLRILIAVLGAAVCLSCQSTEGKSSEPTILVSEPELRSTVDAMASAFAGRIELLSLRLSSETNSTEVRRRLLFMKKKTITSIETASDHPKALTSYFDLWSLSYQLEIFLEHLLEDSERLETIEGVDETEDPKTKEALEKAVEEMITVYRNVRMQFQTTAKTFLPPESFDEVVASVQQYVENYAIEGTGGAITRINFSETAVGSVLSPVLNMTMSPFRAMEGVGKGGDAAKDLVGVTEQDKTYRGTLDPIAKKALEKKKGKKYKSATEIFKGKLPSKESVDAVVFYGKTDAEWDKLTVSITGLVDPIDKVDGKLFYEKKKLVLTYARPGDEFKRTEDDITFKGSKWEIIGERKEIPQKKKK